MTVEERLRDGLDQLAAEIRPRPDPYGRVRARARRGWRRNTLFAGVTAVVTAAALTLAMAGGPAAPPPPGKPLTAEQQEANMLAWSQRLIESPTRGSLAGDAGYVERLHRAVLAAGPMHAEEPTDRARVLFAGDVGGHRIALVAFYKLTRGRLAKQTDWVTEALRVPVGTTAEDFVAAAPRDTPTQPGRRQTAGIEPFIETSWYFPGEDRVLSVGVAPQGCTVASAPSSDLSAWRAEPGGSYVVRAMMQPTPEWRQVTCAGVVRFEAPVLELGPYRDPPGDLDALIAGARGRPDRTAVHNAVLRPSLRDWIDPTTMVLVWGGRISGTPHQDGPAVLTVARTWRGAWIGQLQISYARTDPGGAIGGGTSFTMSTVFPSVDPDRKDAMFAISFGGWDPSHTLVIAPTGAVSVRAVRDGSRLAEAPVAEDAALLPVAGDGIRFQALDGSGRVIAEASPFRDGAESGAIDRWSD